MTHPIHRLVSLKTPVLSIHTLPPQEQLEALFSGLFLTEKYSLLTVSYTHLTLPTKRIV